MFPTRPTPSDTCARHMQTIAAQCIRRIRQLNAGAYMQAGAHLRTYAHTQIMCRMCRMCRIYR